MRPLEVAAALRGGAGRVPRGARLFIATSLGVTAAIGLGAEYLARSPEAYPLTPIFRELFAAADGAGAAWLVAVLLAAALVPGRLPVARLLHAIAAHRGALAIVTLLVLSLGARIVYFAAPLSMDEYAPYFQSQVFAAGRLAGRFPPSLIDWLVPKGFQNYFFNVSPADGRVASAYWPSFALLLTPFTACKAAWICNPVISALTLLAIHRLAWLIFEDAQACGLAVLFTAASPVFFADGVSFYAMPAHLLANTCYACLLATPTPRRAAVAGVLGSVALTLHNPVPHLLFALPWVIALIRRPQDRRSLAALVAGYLPLCLTLGLGWALYAAGLQHTAVESAGAAAAGAVAPGAMARLAEAMQHAGSAFAWPTAALLLVRLIGLAKLWVWAVPGLLLLAGSGAWRWRHDRTCRLLAASASLTLLGYLFVPFDQGHGWGYRYFHSAWVALPILAAGALTRKTTPAPVDAAGVMHFMVACALFTLLGGIGVRAVQIHEFIARHRGQMPAYAGTEPRVVIFDVERPYYARDLIQNDPWLRKPEILMITHGAIADAQMMRSAYPDRHQVYRDRHGSVWSAAAVAPP